MNYLPLIEQSFQRCLEIGENHPFESVVGTGSFAAWHNLGVFYEVQGRFDQAIHCYRQASLYQYRPSMNRLREMGVNLEQKY